MEECNHIFESGVNTLIRTHSHKEPKTREDGTVFDEYQCLVCKTYKVAAERIHAWIPAFDQNNHRIISVIQS